MTECPECGQVIEGDIMIPEGPEGLMHPSCWTEWVQSVETEYSGSDTEPDGDADE